MKRSFITSLVLISMLLVCLLTSCTATETTTPTPEAPESQTQAATATPETEAADPLWKGATYTENTTLGQGSKTITVIVEAGSKKITFTVKTDAETLGQALTEIGILQGSQGPYGLMVEKVNGIQAIYDTDHAYWGLYSHGEYAMNGADTTSISDGDQYEWVYTKA